MQALATEAEVPSRELGAARAALATARAELTAREDKVLQILSYAQGDILEDEQLQHILHVVGEAQERIGTAAAGFAKVEEQVAELRSALKHETLRSPLERAAVGCGDWNQVQDSFCFNE